MTPTFEILILLTSVGSGIVGGVFFAFSTFVMRALADLPAAAGIAAMQRIDIVVINPWFMTPFLGTAILCVGICIATAFGVFATAPMLMYFGSTLYVFGTFGVTIAFNVPRNNTLATVDPVAASSEKVWRDYVKSWTRWNHVRTAAAILAAGVFAMALIHH